MTNCDPLVTIAMVTFNSSMYLSQAIDSVLASTYTNFELIISDDNSKDQTWDIIESYSDQRIRKFRNSENIGEYNNRNKCIENASGEYFIFIDGDDMIYPWGLNFIVSEILKFPTASMALAMQWRDYIFYPYLLSPLENMRFTYFGDSFLNNSFAQTLFRTSILKAFTPFPSQIKSGDTYIKKLISVENDVLLVNGPISWWRRTPGQASQKLSIKHAGIIENWKIDIVLFENNKFPLSKNEIYYILHIKSKQFLKLIIKDLLFFKLSNALILLKHLSIKYLLPRKKNNSKFRANGTPCKPLRST